MSPTTRDQAFYALLFLYGNVLKRDLGPIRQIVRSPRRVHLPVLLDMDQVLAVLAAIEDSPATPFRLIACLLYGCGLRVTQVESPLDHTLKHAQGLLAPPPPALTLPFHMA